MKEKIIFENDIYTCLIENKEICKRLKEISLELNIFFKDHKNILIIGLLNGCVKVLDELKKNLNIDYTIEYVNISSYKGKKQGDIKYNFNKEVSFKDKNIIIVDDIIDSGKTIIFLKEIIKEHKPQTVKTLSLLVRKDSKYLSDWYGFEIKNKYVIGYGMDIDNLFRDLNDIYIQEN